VTVEILEHSIALVRTRAPLPVRVKLPKRADRLLLQEGPGPVER
jgi:hypothetical protein